jgi:hypothetical protein
MIYSLVFILNLLVTEPNQPTAYSYPQKKDITEKIDVSGFWEGTITRDEGYGRRTVFQMELTLIQKGRDITGTSIVRSVSEKRTYNAKMDLAGKVNKTVVKYIEHQILSYDPIPDAEWCIKKVELIHKIKGNTPCLEGLWEGATGSNRNCIPGRVELKKKPPRV